MSEENENVATEATEVPKVVKVKKAKKTKERLLLLPGSMGWEIWKGVPGGDLALVQRSEEESAWEISNLPAGEITMAFPVREVSALPFKTPSTDDGLIQDLAEMHVERLGMRPAFGSGVLEDCYAVAKTEDELLLLPVVLTPPEEGAMPKRSPSSFDVSVRCLPLAQDSVAVWKEFGRWVFAVSRGDSPVHFQALPGHFLSEQSGREIQMSLYQLQIQGMLTESVQQAVIWVEEEQPRPSQEHLEEFKRGFGGQVSVEGKPQPQFSKVPCRLLPADIRAERTAKKKKQQLIALVSLVALAYIGLIAWGVVNLMGKEKEAAVAQEKADALAPEVQDLQTHLDKWSELDPVTEIQHFPVETLFQVSKIAPPSGLRFERAEFNNQMEVSDDGSIRLLRRITIRGKASELALVNQLSQNLHNSSDLSYYRWNTPEATQVNDGRWSFVYTGTPKSGGATN